MSNPYGEKDQDTQKEVGHHYAGTATVLNLTEETERQFMSALWELAETGINVVQFQSAFEQMRAHYQARDAMLEKSYNVTRDDLNTKKKKLEIKLEELRMTEDNHSQVTKFTNDLIVKAEKAHPVKGKAKDVIDLLCDRGVFVTKPNFHEQAEKAVTRARR